MCTKTRRLINLNHTSAIICNALYVLIFNAVWSAFETQYIKRISEQVSFSTNIKCKIIWHTQHEKLMWSFHMYYCHTEFICIIKCKKCICKRFLHKDYHQSLNVTVFCWIHHTHTHTYIHRSNYKHIDIQSHTPKKTKKKNLNKAPVSWVIHLKIDYFLMMLFSLKKCSQCDQHHININILNKQSYHQSYHQSALNQTIYKILNATIFAIFSFLKPLLSVHKKLPVKKV